MTYEHKLINGKRSFTEYAVSSPTQSFAIGFELYEDEQNIHVTLNNTPIEDLGYTFVVINSLTIEVTPAIPSGVLRIQRETDIDDNKHKFSAGAIFNALSMDENFEQIRQSQQETRDGFDNLSNRVVPLVDGLEEALEQAATASQAAQEAAEAAEEASNITRSHTTLTDRDATNAHPVASISYGTVNLGNFVDGVDTVAQLLAISDPFDGMRLYLHELSGWFIYDSTKVGVNDGGTVINGWVRQYILFVTPKMFGIKANDAVGNYGDKLIAMFNSGYPVLLGNENIYSEKTITINNKHLSLQGVSKLKSKLVFKASGHGLVLTTNDGTHTFSIHNCAITTDMVGISNGSGFKYDASAYIDTLPVMPNGFKQLGRRNLNRGQINHVDIGSSDDSESNKGWAHALEFIGAMNFSVSGLHMRLPTDNSGNGVWIHGDGMPTDFHFSDIYSFGGDKVFRFNDYVEGFHLSDFELVNCNHGIWNEADSATVINNPVRMLATYISSGHILSYKNCIVSTWMSSAKLTALELYVWNAPEVSTVSQGINVVTCDSVLIADSTIVNANASIGGTTLGIQLGTGWGNSINNCVLKGASWYAGIAIGTNSVFTANTLANITVDNSQTAILVNESNCVANQIDAPNIRTSTALAISLSAAVLSKNSINFRNGLYAHNYQYTSDTTFNVDISASQFTQLPVDIDVSEVSGVFGGLQYAYRRDVSTPTNLVIQVTKVIDSPSTSTRGLFITVKGV